MSYAPSDLFLVSFAALLMISDAKESHSETKDSAALDHIILGASDLKTGIKELEDLTGVKTEYGGKHPHLGTENALISLGEHRYLEILAPAAGAKIDSSMSFLSGLPKLTPVLWALSTTDAGVTIQRLGAGAYKTSSPKPGSRVRPDGTTLEWKTFNIEAPQMEMAPFFIEWGTKTVHPSKTSPGGCELLTVELTDPHAEDLKKLVETLNLSITVRNGSPAAMRVTLNCPKGKVTIGK